MMIFDELLLRALRIRMIEEEIQRRYPEQQMRTPVHLSIGQEGAAVGVCSALTAADLMVSTHRSHAHYLAKGGDLKRMIAELYGLDEGCGRGHGGSMHLVDWACGFAGSTSIVGGTIPVGVGLGWAEKLKGTKNIAVVCLGDAAIEEGVFHESANFASLHKCPVLFVCENNKLSCYTGILDRQPNRSIAKVAWAHDLEYRRVDGSKFEQVAAATQEIVSEIRKGLGPAFLEIETQRFVEHCGPNNDDHLNYRDPKELEYWVKADPMSKHSFPKSVTEVIQKEIDNVFEFCRSNKQGFV